MARNLAGTWDGAPNYRWKKMVAGVTWVLMCRGQKEGEAKPNTGWLGLDERFWTKEGSASAANEWWKRRLLNPTTITDSNGRELELAAGVRSDEMVAAHEQLQAKASKLSKALRTLGVPVPDQLIPGVRLEDAQGAELTGTIPITSIRKTVSTVTPVFVNQTAKPDVPLIQQLWESLGSIQDDQPVPADATLAYWKDQFLAMRKSNGKPIASSSLDNMKRNLERIVNWFGEKATVDQITEAKCLEYKMWIVGQNGEYFKHDALGGMGGLIPFIRFLWRCRKIDEIRNIDDLKYTVGDQEIRHFSLDQLRLILKEATGPLRLFVFLFANCGMRQRDVSTITWRMLTADGYLERKRHKTRKRKSAPVVKYKLWPETRQLIQEHGTKGGPNDLVFVQENGKPWVMDDELNEKGNRKRDDNFAELWRDFVGAHPEWVWQHELKAKDIRGSVANQIDGNDKFSLSVRYLADVPSGVIGKHYLVPTQPDFDLALAGLREKLLGKAKRKAKAG